MEYVAVFLLMYFGGMLIFRQHDRKTWNSGVCRHNDKPWEYMYTDSQGGRAYRAGEFECHITWISDDLNKA